MPTTKESYENWLEDLRLDAHEKEQTKDMPAPVAYGFVMAQRHDGYRPKPHVDPMDGFDFGKMFGM